MLKRQPCEHLANFERKEPKAYECEECIKTGDRWVHLRTCQECGVTLCCDSSPNKHASKHAASHPGHPVAISAEPGENWAYCYEHQQLMMNP
ncbi:MAG: UBP-type zinc finger domain-containing protein [Cyclobacteriaceae bacterium]|nr:UBP-type zinc finger domain-containing protein [Cyclobacteriaceae bacterium HetDA_MAG_MS6]